MVTIPYLKLRVVSYKNLNLISNFAVKVKLSCDVYAYHMNDVFNITKYVNLTLKNIRYSDNEIVIENNWTIGQRNEILHSVVNFDVLLKGADNE